jgi:hypothetical protein
LVAGRVVVRDEEGGLTLSLFRFLPLGGQAAALGAKQPVRCKRFVADNEYELTPISMSPNQSRADSTDSRPLPRVRRAVRRQS